VTTLAPLTYSPYDYAIHEDPYPTYARLRAEAPVFCNEDLDFFAFSRHADVLAAFRDVDRYSNSYGVSLDPSAYGPDAHRAMSLLAMDPPRHTRMRSIAGKSFTPRRVAEMRRTSGSWRSGISVRRSRRAASTSSATSPAVCRWT